MILNFAGPLPGFIKYTYFNSAITVATHATFSGSAWGHSAAGGAEAVGAAHYARTPIFGTYPPTLESFSSAGPARILFTTAGERLANPLLRLKPNIVAPDGGNNTLLGRDTDGDGWPNFFGTSAAAPHAAAVAALMLERVPGLNPSGIYAIQERTALDMGLPGPDFETGQGLLQADAALEALSNPQIALGLSLSRHVVSPGAAVQVDASITNPGSRSLQDVYFALYPPPGASAALGCPADDAVAFLANGFADVFVRCVASAPPQALVPLFRDMVIPGGLPPTTVPNLFTFVWPSGLPAGPYSFKLFSAPPWAFFNGTGTSAQATDTFTATP
jgi:hypothetical protein